MNADSVQASSVYGPVQSWRVGSSLGIDLLLLNSICSFNCTYCQLGFIQVRINQRRLFVPTERVAADLRASRWREAGIVTFSGNGEPTLAQNLGDCIRLVKDFTGLPTLVLTSGSLLHLDAVRRELSESDRVYVKLDAGTESAFQRINRPVPGVTLEGIVEGLSKFRAEYSGLLGIQSMFLKPNLEELDAMAAIIERIQPDEVQLNTPSRPYPSHWVVEARGSHQGADYSAKPLKPISRPEAAALEERLRETVGGKIRILSFYSPR